ncbi:SFT2-domain-containing protein [Pseudovirgaria hyperparasitica]|uniref:Protein transport protein SFT2 n=1 Tax=Pseudovirgaria hyperparasitica TaxID=470096 RepID=A0A6A6WGK9_9PEZI|nr:SFT2-domain-containing protein [Pseudovirgaria hyperparasitica]KAF2761948.1 SFT2-domain-containing protein [Pseudovirgaria hyperparasitica]
MSARAFQDQMSSMGWTRRDDDIPVNTNQSTPILSRLKSLNPFGDGGYVRLPTSENPGAPLPAPSRREEEEAWFALSRWDRILIFAGLNLAAIGLFAACIGLMFTPVFLLRPRKFPILWTMGSVLFLASWAVMMGPMVYFGSIALTLWFSIHLHSTVLTFFAAMMQLVALLWYAVSYFPMGSTGLRFGARFAGNRVAAWMNG